MDAIKFYPNVTMLHIDQGIVGFDVNVKKNGKKIGTKRVIVKVAIEKGRRDKTSEDKAWYPRKLAKPFKDYIDCYAFVIFDEFEPEEGEEEKCPSDEDANKLCKEKACSILGKNFDID